MNFTDWTPIIISALSGGGVFVVWLNQRHENKMNREVRRKESRARAEQAEADRQELHTNFAATAADVLGKAAERHELEFKRIGARQDILENRNAALAARNDDLVTKLAESHRNLRITEQALIDAERKLMESELRANQRSTADQRTITELQEKISILKTTITELRQQVDQLTQALADCAKKQPDGEACPLLEEDGQVATDGST